MAVIPLKFWFMINAELYIPPSVFEYYRANPSKAPQQLKPTAKRKRTMPWVRNDGLDYYESCEDASGEDDTQVLARGGAPPLKKEAAEPAPAQGPAQVPDSRGVRRLRRLARRREAEDKARAKSPTPSPPSERQTVSVRKAPPVEAPDMNKLRQMTRFRK